MALAVLASLVLSANAFVPSSSRSTRMNQQHKPLYLVADTPPPSDDDFTSGGYKPDEDLGGSSVDWDAEWKKVVQEQKSGESPKRPSETSSKRPGEGYYKSEAEIAAIRAANKATEQVNRAAAKMPSLPSWSSLQGDWKFWVGLIAIISIGTSVLTAQSVSVPPPTSSGGSYYI